MPLNQPTTSVARQVARTTLASAFAALVFTVVVSVVAWNTAEGSGPMPARERADGGDIGGDGGVANDVTDAGVVVDAGPVEVFDVPVGPDAGPEPDAGPPTVDGPPYDANDVAAAAVSIVTGCAADALRWDPSLGGSFTLRVMLPEAGADQPPTVEVQGLGSPILRSCLARRGPTIALPAGARDVLVRQVVEARGALASGGVVSISDVTVVAVAEPMP